MLDSLFEKAKALKPGAVVITLKLPTIGFSFCQVPRTDNFCEKNYFNYFLHILCVRRWKEWTPLSEVMTVTSTFSKKNGISSY